MQNPASAQDCIIFRASLKAQRWHTALQKPKRLNVGMSDCGKFICTFISRTQRIMESHCSLGNLCRVKGDLSRAQHLKVEDPSLRYQV